jgi:hypothetical protein
MRGTKLLILIGAIAVAAIAAPGSSGRSSPPRAHAAGFPSSINVAVPPGGDASVVSPALPPSATQATVTAAPTNAAGADPFAALTSVFAQLPTRGARFVQCILIYQDLVNVTDGDYVFGLDDPTLQLLFLHVCVQMALRLPTSPVQGARAAAAGCSEIPRAISITISKSGGMYHAQVSGVTHKPSGRLPFTVACRHRGSGLQFTVKPRKRGRSVRSVVGPTLGIGYASHATTGASVSVHTGFAVK